MNFSDATVAIAITLLLLPLVDVAGEIRDRSLGDLLHEHAGTVLAFFVSFVVIARLWLSHHRLFEAVRSYSRAIIQVNFVWLASIAFLPFSSNLIAKAYSDPGVNAFYIGTMAVASASMAVMQWLVVRDPELLREDGRTLLHPIDAALTFVAMLVAMAGSALLPTVGIFWLFLLVPTGWLASWLERRRRA